MNKTWKNNVIQTLISPRLVGGVLVAGLVLAGCVGATGETTTTKAPTTTEADQAATTTTTAATSALVPDVLELDAAEATQTLEDAGFQVVASDARVVGSFENVGLIGAQTPRAGSDVELGVEVEISLYGVSTPPEDEAVAILKEQSHGVILGFAERYNLLGVDSGHLPLQDSDPYGGAVRTGLELMEVRHQWMVDCHAAGVCTTEYDPARVDGVTETLVRAGEGEITPFGDGTYYVEGVYYPPTGEGAVFEYLSGFRFIVEDGRAVLVDAASWLDPRVPRGTWLSELAGPVGSEVLVDNVASGLEVEATRRAFRYMDPATGQMWVEVVVTNNTDTLVGLYQFGVQATGEGAAAHNELQESWQAHEVNGVWGRNVDPGETQAILVAVSFDPGRNVGPGGSFSFGVSDFSSESPLFDMTFAMETVEDCGAIRAEVSCGYLPEIAREHGLDG